MLRRRRRGRPAHPYRTPLLSLDAQLSLKQDSTLRAKFGAWLRANSRGTDATLTVRSRSESLLTRLKAGLETEASLSVALSLSLRYQDTQGEVQMIGNGLHPDKINVIPACGGHKDAIAITDASTMVISSCSELTAQRFAKVGEVSSVESGLYQLPITVKFSTNITSLTHGGRTMFWRAEVVVADGDQLISTVADSVVFEYHPREPKIGDQPRLKAAVSDGRAGDLVVLFGDRLGAVHSSLQCHISYPDSPGRPEVVLERELAPTSSAITTCFTTRLPANIIPGPAMVHVRDQVDGIVSNKIPFEIKLTPAVPMEAPAFTTSRNKKSSRKPSHEESQVSARCMGPPGAGPIKTNSRDRQLKRQQRADKPYERPEPICPPISPDSEYNTPNPYINGPPCTPNPYRDGPQCMPLDEEPLFGELEDELGLWGDRSLHRCPSWLNEHQSLAAPGTEDLNDCRQDLLSLGRTVSEEFLALSSTKDQQGCVDLLSLGRTLSEELLTLGRTNSEARVLGGAILV